MTREEIIAGAEAFGTWYHAIELTPGYVTKSRMTESFPQWDQVRAVRKQLDYQGKNVLDLGTMDGMWAFEAEKLGAEVTAGDIWQGDVVGQTRFLFAREALNSRVKLWTNANAHNLWSAKHVQFDIIQCLGLLYHVQNPMLVLHQLAASLVDSGFLLLETACLPGNGDPIMRFNSDKGIYWDDTTFWAPNWPCLRAMLNLAGFEVDTASAKALPGKIERVALVCKRVGKPDGKLGLE